MNGNNEITHTHVTLCITEQGDEWRNTCLFDEWKNFG